MRAGHASRLVAVLGVLAGGCAGAGSDEPLDFPAEAIGKSDAFGRSLAGVAAPYPADLSLAARADELRGDALARRQVAWDTVYKIVEPVPLLGLMAVKDAHPEVSWPVDDVPEVPRFETWYGLDDLERMFEHLYGELGPDRRAARAPFGAEAIAEAMVWNAGAAERSDRWPLERYLRFIKKLGTCPAGTAPEACAPSLEAQLGGATSGTTRILYSPGAVGHMLGDYASMAACLARLDALAPGAEPGDPANFTACFSRELPADAVLVKAQWVRADVEPALPAFDTDAATLRARLGGSAMWPEGGDRKVVPGAGDIYTIRLRDGSVYRLAGLHIMTKELRHWQWITLWWSDAPDVDFGADRPARFAQLPGMWQRYKMCAVGWFDEADPELGRRFAALPTLADALDATGAVGQPTWCSNPYLEHGRGNARTNCIGCHQHGGSTVADDDGDGALEAFDLAAVIADDGRYPATGRAELRSTFPADYMYSFNRVDDVAGGFQRQMDFADGIDHELAARVTAIVAADGDLAAGAARFAARCAACHGDDGHGGIGPDLRERVPSRDAEGLARTLLSGKGDMPAWAATFDDGELADLVRFLQDRFGTQ